MRRQEGGDCGEGVARQGSAICWRFGNPAAVEPKLCRPVTLRPRLSVGLALSFVWLSYASITAGT